MVTVACRTLRGASVASTTRRSCSVDCAAAATANSRIVMAQALFITVLLWKAETRNGNRSRLLSATNRARNATQKKAALEGRHFSATVNVFSRYLGGTVELGVLVVSLALTLMWFLTLRPPALVFAICSALRFCASSEAVPLSSMPLSLTVTTMFALERLGSC